jgi:hypothetical protein
MNISILSKTQNLYTGSVITTFLLDGFPWRLLCELNTHRQITKNAESSRARPTHSVIEQVLADPYIPVWTKAEKGMQGEIITDTKDFDFHWLNYRDTAVSLAQSAIDMGLHKQDANSYLHPFMRVSVILTATHENWLNFFRLRAHEAAKPCFQLWAYKMQDVYNTFHPSVNDIHKVYPQLSMLANCGKIATVSYAKHAEDRTEKALEELALKMINSDPVHISPFQHCAYAVDYNGIVMLDKDKVYLVNDYHDNATTFSQERSICDATRLSTSNYKNWLPLEKVVNDLV